MYRVVLSLLTAHIFPLRMVSAPPVAADWCLWEVKVLLILILTSLDSKCNQLRCGVARFIPCLSPVSDTTSSSPLTPATDTPVAVTQQLLSSASLDGSASSSASAVFEPVKSDPSECECCTLQRRLGVASYACVRTAGV